MEGGCMTVRLKEPRKTTETAISLTEDDGSGTGSGGPTIPADGPSEISEHEPDRGATPAGAARLFTYLAMFWLVALFGTIALTMESRWVHAKDWFAIPLPTALYINSLILLGSSVAMEFARRSLRAGNVGRASRSIFFTATLGVAFLAGQVFGWQQLGREGSRAAANPGSFFFYLITGAHGALLIAGLAFLGSVGARIGSTRASARSQSALGTIALYWHFLDVLWLGLFALLFGAVA
jgi:cytochrome c oxidase subunit III